MHPVNFKGKNISVEMQNWEFVEKKQILIYISYMEKGKKEAKEKSAIPPSNRSYSPSYQLFPP